MHSSKPSQLSACQTSDALSVRTVSTKVRLRARLCTVSLLSADLVAFALSAFVAFALCVASDTSPYQRAITNVTTLGAGWHGWGSMLVLASLLSYLGARGHYTSRVPSWTQLGDVVIATTVALACDIFLTVAVYDRPVATEGMLRWIAFCPCLLLLRAAARRVLHLSGMWTLRTLIVAVPADMEAAEAALTSDPALGYRLAGSVTPGHAASLSDEELLGLLVQRGADFVVITAGTDESQAEHAALDSLRRIGIPIALVPGLRGLPVTGFRQHYFVGHDIVMLVGSSNLARPMSRIVKAAFDQIAAIILLVLLAPLLFTLAALIRADGGPSLYRHRRIGAGGRMFDCLKFRSMGVDADSVLRRLLANDPEAADEWAATQKLRDDPRITRIGRFLRASSLDELPQLLNVVRGEMSLVGPRPIVRAEVARYGSNIEHYYAAKPGLTGLWQVSGRSDMSYARRVQLDVWYVRNWSLWHDIAILFKTVPAVCLQRGAH